MRFFRRLALITVATLGTLTCDDPPVPGSGVLTITLISPNGPEGAAHLTIFGGGLGEVNGLGSQTFSHTVGDNLNVVVVRDQPGELRFTVAVADTTIRPTVAIVEVAGGDDRLRTDLQGYRVEVRP
jgi:hypothetical protein